MQKLEKWRVKELALVLKQLAVLLKNGDNCEWANVFFHFHLETQIIINSKEFDLDQLKKLLINIKSCFSGISSLMNLILRHENSEEKTRLNQDLHQTRARLLKILTEMEILTIEYIS